MWRSVKLICLLIIGAATPAFAQSLPLAGTVVTLSATGEVRAVNDQALASLTLEEQDKDKVTAASRLNLKMRQGVDVVKREDPSAVLRTRGYYTYPIYAVEPDKVVTRLRPVIGWRVGESLDVTTSNLIALPKTLAAAQRILSLNNLSYSLTDGAARRLDEERIRVTYSNLMARIAAIAKVMGRTPGDVTIESLDIDNAAEQFQPRNASIAMMANQGVTSDMASLVEPSFEPGETVLHLRMVSKLQVKAR